MGNTTDSELFRKYTPFIWKVVHRFCSASPGKTSFWKEDMFQVASVAFWQGWKFFGKPNTLSFQNLAYLKTAMRYALFRAFCDCDGVGLKPRQIKLDNRAEISVVPSGLFMPNDPVTHYSDKLLGGTTTDNSDPYFVATFTDWLENGMDSTSRNIVKRLLLSYEINGLVKTEGLSSSSVWRKRRALRKSFSDYVDFPKAGGSA